MRRSISALSVLFLMFAVALTPALAAGSISLDPAAGPVGTVVTVTGSAFTASNGAAVTISFGATDVTPGTPPTISSGGFIEVASIGV